jgi:hydroxyacid-oxoacid transhydrogenase
MPVFDHPNETVFTWAAPPIKFGLGATSEIGFDLANLGVQRAAVVTDPGLAATGLPGRVADLIKAAGIEAVVFDGVHVEPTDVSMNEAGAWARSHDVDGFVAVGGGSSIDTAKAMNLFATNEGEVIDYLNKPIGNALAPRNPLRPLIAVPTTAGTGSESTPVCVLDVLGLKVKTGISHPRLRPTMAVVDPLNTVSLPQNVTAATGMDVLCHALESFTARPFDSRPRYASPDKRVAYNGGNPISDLWSAHALELLGRWFRRAVHSPFDLQAREGMLLAAMYAGIGFGNAGVHIPHACAYPIAGMVRDYHPAEYPSHEAMVPHGISVVLTAPAAFRFTYPALPERHVEAARLLGSEGVGVEALPNAIIALCKDVGIPSGLEAVGYGAEDVPGLVDGALKQQRLLAVAPRDVTAEELATIFDASMRNW